MKSGGSSVNTFRSEKTVEVSLRVGEYEHVLWI
jgi:hypothetical protein